MRLFMETTKVPAATTAQQIQELLVQAGARQVLTQYDDQREVSGLHFILSIDNQDIPFKMPIRTEKLNDYFRRKNRGHNTSAKIDEIKAKSKRVAWRQLYRWVEAQLAFVDTGMAKPAEVFMPYIEVGPDLTFFQKIEASKFSGLMLTDGGRSAAK